MARTESAAGPNLGARAWGQGLLVLAVWLSLAAARQVRAQGAPPMAMTPAPLADIPPMVADADDLARRRAPAMVVDLSEPDTARAGGRLSGAARVAPQGTVISAVLETAIASDRPGVVRAVVGHDVRTFDGATVVIPHGARLIGDYQSGVALGRSRAFVVWTRLRTPDGVSIGLEGKVATRFLRRFDAAVLMSVIDGGVQAEAIKTPQQASRAAALALQGDVDMPTTFIVSPGRPIRVFVARDLDVSTVIAAR